MTEIIVSSTFAAAMINFVVAVVLLSATPAVTDPLKGAVISSYFYKSFSPAVFYIGPIVSLLNLICLGNTLLPLIHRAESRPPEVNA